jgi:hypothetical protein
LLRIVASAAAASSKRPLRRRSVVSASRAALPLLGAKLNPKLIAVSSTYALRAKYTAWSVSVPERKTSARSRSAMSSASSSVCSASLILPAAA